MLPISFCKFHGFGNDYIVVEGERLAGVSDIGAFAQKICHRNTGVGADGIAVLEKLKSGADYACRIINPDGSEAGFSGNGTRCAVAYLYYKNLWQEKSLKLGTKSGVKIYELLEQNDSTFRFRAELGKAGAIAEYAVRSAELKAETANKVRSPKSEVRQPNPRSALGAPHLQDLPIVAVDVGNPVAVVFVADFDEMNWRAVGKELETHARFPDRTNVVFVKIVDEENVEIKIWERGAGETASSGTCSIAAAVASAFTGKTGRRLFVRADGGTTETVWREDGEMLITGRADLVFCGELP